MLTSISGYTSITGYMEGNVIAVLTYGFSIMIDHQHFFQFEVQPSHWPPTDSDFKKKNVFLWYYEIYLKN